MNMKTTNFKLELKQRHRSVVADLGVILLSQPVLATSARLTTLTSTHKDDEDDDDDKDDDD